MSLYVHYGFASVPRILPHPVWACQTFGSFGSTPVMGLSLSLCADSHAWTRSCNTIPMRYGRNINCQNLSIRGPHKHFIYHCVLSFFRLFHFSQVKPDLTLTRNKGRLESNPSNVDCLSVSSSSQYDSRPQVKFYCCQIIIPQGLLIILWTKCPSILVTSLFA